MSIGKLFLQVISTGVISPEELDWVTYHQSYFSRCENSTAIKLGKLVDSGQINLACRI